MNSSLYEIPRKTICERYSSHLSGDLNGAFCIVSNTPLETAAMDALYATAQHLGYNKQDVVFVSISPLSIDNNSLNSGNENVSHETSASSLSGTDLLTIIENYDPLALVVTDAAATQRVANGYHAQLPYGAKISLLGRATRAFENFADMIKDEKRKQLAWATLKSLPHR